MNRVKFSMFHILINGKVHICSVLEYATISRSGHLQKEAPRKDQVKLGLLVRIELPILRLRPDLYYEHFRRGFPLIIPL